jgi:glyceraldehyde-3-phosphate dehydrogenase/erythrose-4-phosphate dehydrogenase
MDAFVDDLAWYDNEWAYASKLIDMAAVVNAGSARG